MNNNASSYDIVILGAGFGGLGMAAQLKREGVENFVILERADRVGGVWRDNSYPGAACDTESHLYCYSFYPHLGVSKMYADRDELLGYLESMVEHFELDSHILLNSEVSLAQWDDKDGLWNFEISDGSQVSGRFFVPAWGQLNKPSIPFFKGLNEFSGDYFHSAQWNHEINLVGRKVASVGAAASAVQYVPEIAPMVEHLTVFQRSPNWIMPRNQIVFSENQLEDFKNNPSLFEESRRELHAFRENGFERTRQGTDAQKEGIEQALSHLENQVTDFELRKNLTPDYEFGCKRILRSDDYYPALMRDNVSLEVEPIQEFVSEGILTKDGKLHEAEVVIFGTGFESQAFQGDLEVLGRDGENLRNHWEDGAEAYLGICVPNFPNMFIIYGPNTNLNHNSIITMLEIQQKYIMQAVGELSMREGTSIEVKKNVFEKFNEKLQESMEASAFSSNCSSWYKNAAGKVINNWSGTVDEYQEIASKWRSEDFKFSSVSKI